MKKITTLISITFMLFLSGCAGIEFGNAKDEAFTYYEPAPYLFVTTTEDCVSTAKVVVLPGAKKGMRLKSGWGSAKLTVNLENGMITSVGQETDTKIPETITATAGLAATAVGMLKERAVPTKLTGCKPAASLYPIVSGKPDMNSPLRFTIEPK